MAITQEKQMMIIQDYTSSIMTIEQISKKNNVAGQTVYNVLYKYYDGPENVPSRAERKAALLKQVTENMNETKTVKNKKTNKKNIVSTSKRYSKRELKARIEKKEMEEQLECEVLTVPYAVEEPEYNPIPEEYQDQIEPAKLENISTLSIEFAGEHIFDGCFYQIEESDNYYECWLCAGRHITGKEMEGIFNNTIPDHILNDFDKLKKLELEFINKHIPKDENDNYTKTLVVYVTGTQAPLSTLIALSYEANFNLHLMHYDGAGNYNRQIIRGGDEDNYIDMSTLFSKLDGQLYFYNTTCREIAEISRLGVSCYCLMLADVNDNETSTSINRKIIVCKSFDDLFNIYPRFLKAMMEKSSKHWVYARTLKMHYGLLTLDTVLAKSFNYRTTNFSTKQQDGND